MKETLTLLEVEYKNSLLPKHLDYSKSIEKTFDFEDYVQVIKMKEYDEKVRMKIKNIAPFNHLVVIENKIYYVLHTQPA